MLKVGRSTHTNTAFLQESSSHGTTYHLRSWKQAVCLLFLYIVDDDNDDDDDDNDDDDDDDDNDDDVAFAIFPFHSCMSF